MTEKTHLVFGAGLIGSYLAGCFQSKGLDVTLLGRASGQDATRNGLTVTDFLQNRATLSPPVYIQVAEKHYDIVWLTVKCTSTEGAIKSLKGAVGPETIIICCQNGFGSDQVIRQAFANNTVLRAVVGFNVAAESDAHWHRATDGRFVVEFHSDINHIIQQAESPLLPTHISTSIVAEQWAKLQLNLANSINALADIPVKSMIEQAGYRKIIVGLMRELLMVTDAMEITLPKVAAVPAHWIPRVMSLPNWAFMRVAQKMLAIDPSARTSMWWDLHNKRTTEINYLNAAVVNQGKKLGIECPINRNTVNLINAVEQGHESIGFSAETLQARLLV